jgi:hypothetical protein
MFTVAKILDHRALLLAAADHGEITFISRNARLRVNRYLVTVDSLAVPMDVTDELWEALYKMPAYAKP